MTPAEVFGALRAISRDAGYPVIVSTAELEARLRIGGMTDAAERHEVQGMTDQIVSRVYLRSGMDVATRVAVLAHEVAHAQGGRLLAMLAPYAFGEVRAETAAGDVEDAFGIHPVATSENPTPADYVALYAKGGTADQVNDATSEGHAAGARLVAQIREATP